MIYKQSWSQISNHFVYDQKDYEKKYCQVHVAYLYHDKYGL
jgi:hypothetical protein